MMAVIGSALDHRHEQRDGVLHFVWMDVLQETGAEAGLDLEPGQRRPGLVEVGPAALRVGPEHNLTQGVQQRRSRGLFGGVALTDRGSATVTYVTRLRGVIRSGLI